MNISFSRTVDPVREIVSLDEAKLHCRALMDVPDEDGLVTGFIRAAREIGEGHTGRGWFTQTWRLVSDEWVNDFPLPMAGPLQSVTTIKYYDSDGVLQTLATSVYTVDTSSQPGRVCLAAGQTWPALQCDRRAWRIEIIYVVGRTSLADVPSSFKIGTLLLVDHLWENRGSVQVGVGIGAVELPIGISTFFGDGLYWSPPVCV